VPSARTVLGDVPSADLGVCDAHDHLLFCSAQLAGQELDDADAATAELRSFGDLGGQAVVQWTPFGLGRRADLLARVSLASGVAVVAATGLHQAAHYDGPAALRAMLPRLAGLFIEELTTGMRPDPGTAGGSDLAAGPLPRAGLIKVAGSFLALYLETALLMSPLAAELPESSATCLTPACLASASVPAMSWYPG
jgi:phosphotriesterase-related protein